MTHNIKIGQSVKLIAPLRQGSARLVAIIEKGTTPDPILISKWHAGKVPIPKSVYLSLKIDRLIFQREDTGGFVVIPYCPNSRYFELT